MEDSKAQFSAKQEIVSVLIYSQKMVIANAVAPFMVRVHGKHTSTGLIFRERFQL
jgi:hypothetical protein